MTTEQTEVLSAGQLLSQTRESKQLTIQQVAIQLNLKPELIVKIEQDALDPALLGTFARGYLRAYARLLKLPEKQVIELFEQHSGVQASVAKPMRTFSNRTAQQATESRFMWLTYAIGLLLVVLLVIWWWQTSSDDSMVSAAMTPQEIPASAAGTTSAVPEVELQQTEQSVPVQADIPVPDATQLLANAVSAAVEEVIPVEQPQQELVVQGESVVVEDRLKMTFMDNCWIDVVDADENRIAYGTKQSGYVMEVSGKAPFVITLGNPRAVAIEINRQPYDTSGLPENRVAKFTLSRSEP